VREDRFKLRCRFRKMTGVKFGGRRLELPVHLPLQR